MVSIENRKSSVTERFLFLKRKRSAKKALRSEGIATNLSRSYQHRDWIATAYGLYSNNNKILNISTSAASNEIINQNDYYPFGLTMSKTGLANNGSTPDTKYQYNGKEFNADLGLNMLDLGARMYDSATSRFGVIDPRCEKYFTYSPYVFTLNNPILYLDPKGMDNIIYLVALKGSEQYGNANKIAREANKNFVKLGLKTMVKVISDPNKFDPSKIDKTDGVAVFGKSKDQIIKYIQNNLKDITTEGFRDAMNGWRDTEMNPETSENNTAIDGTKTGGNVIAINGPDLKSTGREWLENDNAKVAGFLINHAAGHIAGVSHGNGGDLMRTGSEIQAYIQGANGNPLYYDFKPSCPTCLSDFVTDPSPNLIKSMHKRFGNNSPSDNRGR
jgi:RHS repeat-associated protein